VNAESFRVLTTYLAALFLCAMLLLAAMTPAFA
jgi:hypothetical protein